MPPLVTIIAICYNQADYVLATLNSIKQQTYPAIQLIIADDASADATPQLVREWININWPDAVFIAHKVNNGITKNLNSAIPFVKGSYVKQIGCDDIMEPDAIEKVIAAFDGLPEDYGVVYTDMHRINESGALIDDMGLIEKRGHPVYSGEVYLQMIQKPFITSASIIFKKWVLDKLGGFNEKVFYEDHDFYLRAARVCKFYYLNQKTIQYRVHSGSLINSSSRIKYFYNVYNVYYTNFDNRTPFVSIFTERLLFCIKNLYALHYKNNFSFACKAFFKTRNLQFLKFAVASIPFYLKGNTL
jgi:glycosyltransferase involved in cell wall biosynthesis